MRFASLGSGSKGNATLVATGSTCILIDCGFSAREAEKRLLGHGIDPAAIQGILVTHEHGDHIRGVRNLARKHGIPVYLTHGTSQSLDCETLDVTIINTHRRFTIGEMVIEPVPVPHDAREPCQFVVSSGGFRLGILSDLGHISAAVSRHYRDCDGLMVESNYDSHMLANGPYPHPLKQRVGGDWGHLSNEQTAGLLDLARLQHLVMGHISENNNCPQLVSAMLAELPGLAINPLLAQQESGFDWLLLE